MLNHLAVRARAISRHTGSRKVVTINRAPAGATVASVSFNPAPLAFRANSGLLQSRWYAKVAKASKKKLVLKRKTSELPMVYDEDLEDETHDLSKDLGMVDQSQAMRHNKSFLQSSVQIERIIRSSYPPELVEQAIADHRRLYSAFQQGQLSEEDALSSGFSPRLEIDAFGNPVSASPSSKATSSSSSAKSTASESSFTSSSAPAPDSGSTKTDSSTAKSSSSQQSSKSKKPKSKSSAKSTSETLGTVSSLDADLDAYRLGKKSRIEARGSLQDHVDRAREGQQFPAGAGKMGQEQEPPTLKERRARLEEGYAQLRQDAEDVLYEPMMHRRMEKLKRIMSEKLENEEEELLEHARKHGIGSGRIVDLKGKRAPKAFTVHEDDATGIILRARAFLKEGKWDQAMELYFDLARTNQNSDILSSFAMDAWTAKQVDIAGRSAVEAFNIDQNDLKANTVAARVLLAQHDPERPDAETRLGVALQHVDRALEQQPKWPELIGLKGSVYLARRKYKTACEHFKSALEACDKMHLSRQLRLPLLRDYAKALAGRGKYKLAHSHLKIAHQLEPENIEVISLLAELHEHGFKDLEGAAPFYRMAVQLQPDDVASLVRLGQLFSDPNYSGQNFAAARQCYERAMVLQPQPDFWFPLGWLSMQLGEHDKGMQCLQKAAEADPDANNCWTSVVLLAENYAFDTNPDTQQASLNRAIQLYMFALEEKNDFNVKMNLVKCFMRADRIDDAEALLQVLKMEDPGNVEMKCVLADVYYLADKTQEALREVDSIISTHPAELLPHFMKGKYLYQLGDHKAALPHLEMAASGVIAPSMSSPEFNNLKNILEPEVKAAAERAIAEGKISPPVNRGSTRSGVTAAGEQDAEAETETDRNPNGTTGPRPGSLLSEDEDSGFSSGNGQHPTFVPEALRLLARCFVESERWADAKRVLARAADHDPENPTILLALGESLYHNGDIEDAIFSFRKASVLDRNALRPLFQLGNLYAESSQYDQAITYYLRLIENLERRETDPSARESEEEMTVEDLGQLIYGVYSNLSSCYAELATKDRSNQAKHLRSAKQWAVKAEAMKQEM